VEVPAQGVLCFLAQCAAAAPVAAGTPAQAGSDQRVAWLGGRNFELDGHGFLLVKGPMKSMPLTSVRGLRAGKKAEQKAAQETKQPGPLWQPGLVQDDA
jgi:hypothetical protein